MAADAYVVATSAAGRGLLGHIRSSYTIYNIYISPYSITKNKGKVKYYYKEKRKVVANFATTTWRGMCLFLLLMRPGRTPTVAKNATVHSLPNPYNLNPTPYFSQKKEPTPV